MLRPRRGWAYGARRSRQNEGGSVSVNSPPWSWSGGWLSGSGASCAVRSGRAQPEAATDATCEGDAMADRVELTLRPKSDVKPIDLETAERIGRVARAETAELVDGGAGFGFR